TLLLGPTESLSQVGSPGPGNPPQGDQGPGGGRFNRGGGRNQPADPAARGRGGPGRPGRVDRGGGTAGGPDGPFPRPQVPQPQPGGPEMPARSFDRRGGRPPAGAPDNRGAGAPRADQGYPAVNGPQMPVENGLPSMAGDDWNGLPQVLFPE